MSTNENKDKKAEVTALQAISAEDRKDWISLAFVQAGMSYSGNKAVMKKFKKISRDLYSYYGVTEKDIKNKTKRYSSLVTNLSS